MSYVINKTNGTVLATVLDGTINTSASSLTLVGRNYSNYGEVIGENFVKLLENFAYNIAPSNPLAGQLWWDSGNSLLKVYTGTSFKIVSSCTAQTTAPTTTVAGDLWWDTANDQLYVYNGTTPYSADGWILVGPGYSKVNGKSGAIWEQITDTTSSTHSVVVMYVDGTRTGIISEDSEFTPNVAISGFSTIRPGYNMSSIGTFHGTANNASYLGTQPAANYFRNNIDNSGTGTLSVVNDSGIKVGAGLDLELSVSGTDAQIKNITSGGDIGVYANVSGTSTRVLYINGADGTIEVADDPSTDLGVATKQYVDDSFANSPVLGGVPTAPTMPVDTANLSIATTDFVINNSGFLKNKIYQGNSYIEILDSGTGSANVVIDGISVATASASGMNLRNGATAITQTQVYNGSGNTTVATTQYVKTATTWWGGSAKFVSTDAPNPGVNDVGSNDGDFWFQRDA